MSSTAVADIDVLVVTDVTQADLAVAVVDAPAQDLHVATVTLAAQADLAVIVVDDVASADLCVSGIDVTVPVTTKTMLRLTGASNELVGTDNSPDMRFSTRMTVEMRVGLPDWTPDAEVALIGHSTNQACYMMWLFQDGLGPAADYLTDEFGSQGTQGAIPLPLHVWQDSGIGPAIPDGAVRWLKWTYDQPTGFAYFYIAPDTDGTPNYAQIGNGYPLDSPNNVLNNNTADRTVVGGREFVSAFPMDVYEVKWFNENDELVAHLDTRDIVIDGPQDPTTFADAAPTARDWTVQGTGWSWQTVPI